MFFTFLKRKRAESLPSFNLCPLFYKMIEIKKQLLEDKVKFKILDNNKIKKEINLFYKDIKNLPVLDYNKIKNKFIQSFAIQNNIILFTITTLDEKSLYYGEENISGPYILK